jgi:hypothetical protein
MAKDKRTDIQSLDYVIRSGIAGGIAGCMVRIYLIRENIVLI